MKTSIFLVYFIMRTSILFAQNWTGPINNIRETVLSLSSQGNNLYFGVHSAEGGDYHIKKWNGNSLDSMYCPNNPFKILFHNGELYECGCTRGIRKFDGINWESIGTLGQYGLILDFHFFNNEIYAIGGFDSINGIPVHDIARWDGTNWHAIDTTSFAGGNLRFCFHFNGEFYVGGAISNWDNSLETLVKWNGTNWESSGVHSVPGSINPMAAAVFNNELYLGGYISTSNNFGKGILRYDGTNWKSVGGGIIRGNFPRVFAFHEFNNQLFVGGVFDTAGTIPASMIAAWDGNTWCGFTSNIGGSVFSLGDYANTLTVGGDFTTINGDSIRKLAQWLGGNNFDTCGTYIGIIDIESINEINLSPSPTHDHLKITSPQTNIHSTSILDITGKLLLKIEVNAESFQLDVSSLAAGLYFLVLETPKGTAVKKFVKE